MTVDDVLDFIGLGKYQAIVFLLCGMAYIGFGVDPVLFSFISLKLQDEWNLSALEYGIIPSVNGVFSTFAGPCFAYASDHFGRVWPFALALLIVSVGDLSSAFAPKFYIFVLLRAMASVGGVGIIMMVFPALLESLPTRNRGKVLINRGGHLGANAPTVALTSCLCGAGRVSGHKTKTVFI